jgi:hypothetical protein
MNRATDFAGLFSIELLDRRKLEAISDCRDAAAGMRAARRTALCSRFLL